MNYEDTRKPAQQLNKKEMYGDTEVRWSENGRIIVLFRDGRKEVMPWSRSAYKQLVKNLTASNGLTLHEIAKEKIHGYRISFNERFDTLLLHKFPDGIRFDPNIPFVENSDDRKLIKRLHTTGRKDSYGQNVKFHYVIAHLRKNELPSWMELNSTYRVHADGSIELVKRLSIVNRSDRHDFPAFTVTAQGENVKNEKEYR